MLVRTAREADYAAIAEALRSWWTQPGFDTPEAARERAALLPRLWLQHFAGTSGIVERDGEVAAFLVAFFSADRRDEGYIHFVGVHPAARRAGMARALYERFFDVCRTAGRRRIRCVTTPGNEPSLRFHRAMGFAIEGDAPKPDYDGPGVARIAFVRELDGG